MFFFGHQESRWIGDDGKLTLFVNLGQDGSQSSFKVLGSGGDVHDKRIVLLRARQSKYRFGAQDPLQTGKCFLRLRRHWTPFVGGILLLKTVEVGRNGGIVPDVAPEEVTESQRGSDGLGVCGDVPI